MNMNFENVKFGNEGRDKIISGVKLAADALEVTYGPNGKNSIVSIGNTLKVTKDGYNTVMSVNDTDPYVKMGIKLVQDTCEKTAKDVGDGTSTSGILVREFIEAFKDQPDPILVARNMQTDAQFVIKELQKKAKPVKSKQDLIRVAAISANNDATIGGTVATAFEQVGKDGIVTIEESEGVKDTVEYSEGFRIDNGYYSPYFINTSKNTCELENVKVHISSVKMEELKEVVTLADAAVREKKSLLLIAPEFDSEILVFLSTNLSLLKSCVVISPNHGNYRNIMLDDMNLLLGTKSECKKVVITKDTTTFVGLKDNVDTTEKVAQIKSLIKEGDLSEFDLNFHKKRLANFTAGIATIHVGGYSKIEMQERYDRFEDAVCATQAALNGGILAGGGTALREVVEKLKFNECFTKVLQTPSRLLNTESITSKEMLKKSVIEPFLVTKTVLENAVSTASMILTTDVAIVNNNYMN